MLQDWRAYVKIKKEKKKKKHEMARRQAIPQGRSLI
jgi:hypothetical protein